MGNPRAWMLGYDIDLVYEVLDKKGEARTNRDGYIICLYYTDVIDQYIVKKIKTV